MYYRCAIAALALGLFATPARAEEPAKKPAFELGGNYSIWALNQHQFLLGADNALDDADYVVQNLRVRGAWNKEGYGVVTRLDAAQGWWGVDNSPDVEDTTTVVTDENGVTTGTNTTNYNPYKMFEEKDTNYMVHFDLAYVWFDVPGTQGLVRVNAGRQFFGVGHQLVLDQDYEGVIVNVASSKPVQADVFWALVSEGIGSYKNPTGALMSDGDGDGNYDEYADANVLGGKLRYKKEGLAVEAFGLYYKDKSGGADRTATMLPNGVGYFDSRYHPNISDLVALGLTADGTVKVADGLSYAVEGDYLFGHDDVANADHAAGLLDLNNGDLSGWNAYARLNQAFTAGVPLEVGATFGMGSGDPDPRSGAGNVNKLQTMGFFAFTNVWEDSVMPDVEGISPQGLGSPVSRGYREFENTTAVQGRIGAKPVEPLKIEVSYAWMRATQPVYAFDAATGAPTGKTAQDLGQEIDANLSLRITKGLEYQALYGYFLPGTAAGYLINGNADVLEPAWELKQTLTASF